MTDFRSYIASQLGMNQNINLDNLMGTNNKAPKLLRMEDYLSWKDRFESYIYGLDSNLWIAIETEYERPIAENTHLPQPISLMNVEEKAHFDREKKMFNQLKQALHDNILHQFKQFKTSSSLWIALMNRYAGNPDMIEGKRSLLKKEFEIFMHMKNESLDNLITRYCHMLSALEEYNIDIPNPEKVAKLVDALPIEWDGFILVIKQNSDFKNLTPSDFIGKLQAQELDMRKKSKIQSQAISQDPSLYRGFDGSSSAMSNHSAPKIQTAFFSGSTMNNQESSGSFCNPSNFEEMGMSGFSTHTPVQNVQSNVHSSGQQYCLSMNTPNLQNVTVTIAQEHMALLSAVLT